MFHQPLNWCLPRKVEKHKVVSRCSAYSCMKSSGVHLLPHFHLIHGPTWREDGKQMIFECLSLLFCVFVQHNLREMSLLASGKSPDRPGNTVWEVAGNILTLEQTELFVPISWKHAIHHIFSLNPREGRFLYVWWHGIVGSGSYVCRNCGTYKL